MNRRDFERDALAICSLTITDLRVAEEEEAAHMPITNPHVKSLRKHPGLGYMFTPSLWITINPGDIHDPILQVFAGKEIDMNNFNAKLGPDNVHHASNVA
ncbi:hypothetical protein J3R82DRAFT_1839 [Butyriboletus roseoflavus]|nr:hypothetical protein J3R82DRAFT_1839 [Butyriboletus roseoflavus]